jgi:Holliday junction DNA helicase RuvA
MIAYLSGKILEKEATRIIIDVKGVGYEVFTSTITSASLGEIAQQASLFINTIVREDALLLYGFHTKEEKQLFSMLTSINKIGPKIAIGILSSITPSELQSIVLSNNSVALSKLPGIGAKTAPKIILELKDKITSLNIDNKLSASNIKVQEAISALSSLGFSNAIAQKAVQNAVDELSETNYTIEDLIKKSLKYANK